MNFDSIKGVFDMALDIIIKKLRKAFRESKYLSSIAYAILFGSTVKGLTHSESDYDIFVRLLHNVDRLDLIADLVYLVAKNLGVNEDYIDLVIVDDRLLLSYELLFRVFSEGLPILINQKGVFARDQLRVFSLYYDLKVFLEKFGEPYRYLESILRD